jgi:hypothetical protein
MNVINIITGLSSTQTIKFGCINNSMYEFYHNKFRCIEFVILCSPAHYMAQTLLSLPPRTKMNRGKKTSSISWCHTTNHCRNLPDMCLNSTPETYSLNILPLCPLPYIWVCRLWNLLIVLLFLYFLSSLSQRVVGFRTAHSKKFFPCKYQTKILFKGKW